MKPIIVRNCKGPECHKLVQGLGHYCSPICMHNAKLERDKASRARREPKTGTCKQCGKVFPIKVYTSYQVYCTKGCARKHYEALREKYKPKDRQVAVLRADPLKGLSVEERIAAIVKASRLPGYNPKRCTELIGGELWAD